MQFPSPVGILAPGIRLVSPALAGGFFITIQNHQGSHIASEAEAKLVCLWERDRGAYPPEDTETHHAEIEAAANRLLLEPSILHSSKNRPAITAGKVKHLC